MGQRKSVGGSVGVLVVGTFLEVMPSTTCAFLTTTHRHIRSISSSPCSPPGTVHHTPPPTHTHIIRFTQAPRRRNSRAVLWQKATLKEWAEEEGKRVKTVYVNVAKAAGDVKQTLGVELGQDHTHYTNSIVVAQMLDPTQGLPVLSHAGVREGDSLISVNGSDLTSEFDLDDVVRMMRKTEGQLRLGFARFVAVEAVRPNFRVVVAPFGPGFVVADASRSGSLGRNMVEVTFPFGVGYVPSTTVFEEWEGEEGGVVDDASELPGLPPGIAVNSAGGGGGFYGGHRNDDDGDGDYDDFALALATTLAKKKAAQEQEQEQPAEESVAKALFAEEEEEEEKEEVGKDGMVVAGGGEHGDYLHAGSAPHMPPPPTPMFSTVGITAVGVGSPAGLPPLPAGLQPSLAGAVAPPGGEQ